MNFYWRRYAAGQELIYGNLPGTRTDEPTFYPESHVKVARVYGKPGKFLGPSILLKVMAGDKFNAQVDTWYIDGSTPGTPIDPLSELVNALAGGITANSGGKVTQSDIISSGVLTPGVTQFISQQSSPYTDRPKAYLNWILFDEQFNYVANSSGFEQVPDESVYNNGSYPSNNTEPIVQSDMPITKNGFLYIYVSDESGVDVFFDNFLPP